MTPGQRNRLFLHVTLSVIGMNFRFLFLTKQYKYSDFGSESCLSLFALLTKVVLLGKTALQDPALRAQLKELIHGLTVDEEICAWLSLLSYDALSSPEILSLVVLGFSSHRSTSAFFSFVQVITHDIHAFFCPIWLCRSQSLSRQHPMQRSTTNPYTIM
jgi:hypothetical protein